MQFGDVRTNLHTFKKGEKRYFRKNCHFKMAVPLQQLDQIEFGDRQIERSTKNLLNSGS